MIDEAAQAADQVWGATATAVAVVRNAHGSGGFEFPSAAEMNTVLGMWKDRRTSLEQKRNRIDTALENLDRLAADQESQGYLRQARDSLGLLRIQHDSMLTYVESYIQKLTDAANAKQTGEDDTAGAFKAHRGELPA